MASRKVCTFRYTKEMQRVMNEVMNELKLDRTSVIKLALYHFTAYMSQEEHKSVSLRDLVEMLEQDAPSHFPSFAVFGDE